MVIGLFRLFLHNGRIAAGSKENVRFTPESGHYSALHQMSAYSQKRTFWTVQIDVGFGTLSRPARPPKKTMH
jgi:hypothetical protein